MSIYWDENTEIARVTLNRIKRLADTWYKWQIKEFGPLILHQFCAFNSDPKVIKVLIDKGIDINSQDENGMTALSYACLKNKNIEVVRMLLEAGANPNIQDKSGMTPLLYAMMCQENSDMEILLLKCGANPKLKSKDGWDYDEYHDVPSQFWFLPNFAKNLI